MPILKLDFPQHSEQPTSQLINRVEVGFWHLTESAEELASLWPNGEACLSVAREKFSSLQRIREWMAVRAYVSQSKYAFLGDICYTPQGKPYFKNEEVHLSISHSREWIALAFAPCNVGIDIEVKGNKPYLVREKFLHPSELAMLNSCSEPEMEALRMWTVKEATFKKSTASELTVLTDISISIPENPIYHEGMNGSTKKYQVQYANGCDAVVTTCDYADFVCAICMDKIF